MTPTIASVQWQLPDSAVISIVIVNEVSRPNSVKIVPLLVCVYAQQAPNVAVQAPAKVVTRSSRRRRSMADLLPGGAPQLWLPRTPSKRGYHTTFVQTAARAQPDASAGRACSRERWIDAGAGTVPVPVLGAHAALSHETAAASRAEVQGGVVR